MTGLEYFAFCIRVSAKGTPLGLQFGLDFLIGQLESFAFRVGVLLFQPIGMSLATGLLCFRIGVSGKRPFGSCSSCNVTTTENWGLLRESRVSRSTPTTTTLRDYWKDLSPCSRASQMRGCCLALQSAVQNSAATTAWT